VDEIKLGDVTVTRVEEMHGPLGMTPQELIPDHLANGIVNVAMQTWLVRSEGQVILVDTGVGNDKTRPGHGAPGTTWHSPRTWTTCAVPRSSRRTST
jgi:hypothetical protein